MLCRQRAPLNRGTASLQEPRHPRPPAQRVRSAAPNCQSATRPLFRPSVHAFHISIVDVFTRPFANIDAREDTFAAMTRARD